MEAKDKDKIDAFINSANELTNIMKQRMSSMMNSMNDEQKKAFKKAIKSEDVNAKIHQFQNEVARFRENLKGK